MADKKQDAPPHTGDSGDESSDSDDSVEMLQFKIVVVGDGAVGKTSVINRFRDDQFSVSYKQTIGCDWFNKQLILPGDVHVALSIWDIGGQKIGSKMISNYVFGAHAILFTYDITNLKSFNNLEDWHQVVMERFSSNLPYVAIVGNKKDNEHMRSVKAEMHKKFATKHAPMHSFIVSAKTGENVKAMFYKIAADLAGVTLTKSQLDGQTKVVEAHIVNHPQNDPHTPAPKLENKKSACVVQ